jgi:sugar/nucleoside kinase (ribokinase family)
VVEPSIGAPERPTLLVVGAATRDIDADDPRGWRLGGGVSYAAIAASRLGVRTRALIGVDAAAAQAHELDALSDAGVAVTLVPLASGPVFDNRETSAGREQHIVRASDSLPTSALPDNWRAPTAVVLAPVAAELDEEWASAFPPETLVALGWQGLLRRLTPGRQVERLQPARTAIVERANALQISAEDVAGNPADIRSLLGDGQELIVTNGARGAMYLRRESDSLTARFIPAIQASRVVDATGAGDIFLASWIGARVLTTAAGVPRDAPGETRMASRELAVAAANSSLSIAVRGMTELPTTADLRQALVTLRDRQVP